MADWKPDQSLGGKRSLDLKQAIRKALPDWQVFVRDHDGRPRQFSVRRGHQLALLAGAAILAAWSVTASIALVQRPAQLAAKEQQLDEMLASTRAAQERITATEKLVADIANEVDAVHSNLQTLANSSESLSKDPVGARLARNSGKTRLMAELTLEDDDQPGSNETQGVRTQMRRLEESLGRLRLYYTRAAQDAADTAANRVSQSEQQISRLGIDPGRLVPSKHPVGGLGGPFIPVHPADDDSFAMGALIDRVQQWNGMKAAMQRLPLAVPIHGEFELNSGFGARADPLNHRSAIHEGLDFGAPAGTPVYATGEGVVVLAESWDRYGNTVEIDHGNGIATRYAHMSRIKVKEGQRVTRTTVVGLVGNTGRSTGAHLHYEVRLNDVAKDPIKFISAGRDAPKTR